MDPSSATGTHAGASPSLAPTTDAHPGEVFVNEVHGWSIVVPQGWEVEVNGIGGTALIRDQVIAEVLVFPASGLPLEELGALKVEELGDWPRAGTVETRLVRLPAGEAVRNTMETVGEPGTFVVYLIEEGERQYVISVRGPQDDGDLLADAEALAESFTIPD